MLLHGLGLLLSLALAQSPPWLPDVEGVLSQHRLDRHLAVETHRRAQLSGAPDGYRRAAQRYADLLRASPHEHELRWYRAEALVMAEQPLLALAEYEHLLTGPDNPYQDGARYQRVRVLLQLLQAQGPLDQAPEGPAEQVETLHGELRPVHALSPLSGRLILAIDGLLTAPMTDPDFGLALEEGQPALRFIPAQILHAHGHFDQARARLEQLIEQHPRSDEAAYAAAMMVNSYMAEGDLEAVVALTRRYTDSHRDSDGGLRELLEVAEFKLATQRVDAGEHALAAQAYLDFVDRFPHSEHAHLALYNAAQQSEVAGQADQANDLFIRYIEQYPKSELSERLYFRVASQYSSALQLEQAIDAFERLYRSFPDHVDGPSALYMAGFLRTGLGDHQGAAESFDLYAGKYAEQPDADQVAWLAVQQWERVGPDAARRAHQRHLKACDLDSPSHSVQSMFWLMNDLRSTDPDGAERLRREILVVAFLSKVEGHRTRHRRGLDARGADVAAQVAVLGLERFALAGPRADTTSLRTARPALEHQAEIDAAAMSIIDTHRHLTASAAAIERMTAARLALAEQLARSSDPELQTLALGLKQRSSDQLQQLLNMSAAQGVWTPEHTRCEQHLQRLLPERYPVVGQEARGEYRNLPAPTSAR